MNASTCWEDVYLTQTEAIDRLTKERDDLLAAAGRFNELMLEKDRQIIGINQQRDELLEDLEEYGQHAMSCSVTRWPSTAKCDCGFSEAIAKHRGKV